MTTPFRRKKKIIIIFIQIAELFDEAESSFVGFAKQKISTREEVKGLCHIT